jgi:putative endonuclease
MLSVYILHCADDSYYIGVTDAVQRRLTEHAKGTDPKSYTFGRRPIKLVWFHEFQSVDAALRAERQLKKWTRAKKAALIAGDIALLKALAKPRKG